jgi:hypothetical protein
MLYVPQFAVCSQIHTKHINTVWAELTVVVCLNLLVHHVTSRLRKVKGSLRFSTDFRGGKNAQIQTCTKTVQCEPSCCTQTDRHNEGNKQSLSAILRKQTVIISLNSMNEVDFTKDEVFSVRYQLDFSSMIYVKRQV